MSELPGEILNQADFILVSYEDGGPVNCKITEKCKLVCRTDQNEKIVFWGDSEDEKNIKLIGSMSLPFRVNCRFIVPPEPYKSRFGHKYWVPKEAQVLVIT
ncbi:MAG: hypothetical protein LWY06_02825 [Firmicutes bacterium]|nr:hypothetical protein [Bacillota bacterium]